MKSYSPSDTHTTAEVLKSVRGKLKSASEALAVSVPEEEEPKEVLQLHPEKADLPIYDDAEEQEYTTTRDNMIARRLQPLVEAIERKRDKLAELTQACETADETIKQAIGEFEQWKRDQLQAIGEQEANSNQRFASVEKSETELINLRNNLQKERASLEEDQEAFDAAIQEYEKQRGRRRTALATITRKINELTKKKDKLEAAHEERMEAQAKAWRAVQDGLDAAKDNKGRIEKDIEQKQRAILKQQEAVQSRERAVKTKERSVDKRAKEVDTREEAVRSREHALAAAVREFKEQGVDVPSK